MYRTLCLFIYIFVLSFNFHAAAANKCKDIMATSAFEHLNEDSLRRQNLRLDRSNNLYDLNDGHVIGVVRLLHVNYLYEWAPLDYQQVWVHNGEISKAEMTAILNEPPQTMGRGFYVSTNPFDSQSYGDGLTVFKTSGPVVRVSAENMRLGDFENIDLIKRMQKAGIDALGDHETWMSMISTKHLKIEHGAIEDPSWTDAKHAFDMVVVAHKLKKSNLLRQLPRGIVPNPQVIKAKFTEVIKNITDDSLMAMTTLKDQIAEAHPSIRSELQQVFLQRIHTIFSNLSAQSQQHYLHTLMRIRMFEATFYLLEQGADPNTVDRHEESLLMIAVHAKNLSAVKKLIELGANPNYMDQQSKRSALYEAAVINQIEIFKYILSFITDNEVLKACRRFTDSPSVHELIDQALLQR